MHLLVRMLGNIEVPMTNTETNGEPTENTSEDAVSQSQGSDRVDYGGMGANLDKVDLAHADEVGSDPPGGLGTDIAGGNRELGQDQGTPDGDPGPSGL